MTELNHYLFSSIQQGSSHSLYCFSVKEAMANHFVFVFSVLFGSAPMKAGGGTVKLILLPESPEGLMTSLTPK